jgi:hypothetical protein
MENVQRHCTESNESDVASWVWWENKLHFKGDEGTASAAGAEGRVLMIISAARSKHAKSCDGLRATASHCCTLYSIVMFQSWERPRSMTNL